MPRMPATRGSPSSAPASPDSPRPTSPRAPPHVTLYEADDRLGGHADTHDVPETRRRRRDPRARASTPASSCTTRAPTRCCCGSSPSSASPPRPPRCRCRSATTTPASSGPARSAARASSRPRPTCASPRYLRCSPRSRASTAGPRRCSTVRVRRRARCASSSPTAASAPTSPATSWSRWSPRVWSCDPEVALDYPARYLFTFLQHHGMLGIFGSPQWRTVTGGSRPYVAKVGAALLAPRCARRQGHLGARDRPTGVEVTDGNGEVATYDAVVIATHPGQALSMLAEPTDLQREVLTAMPYSPNTALLHTDTCLMPRAATPGRRWNFRRPARRRAPDRRRRHRHLRPDPAAAPRHRHPLPRHPRRRATSSTPRTVIDRMEYEHPLYNPASVAAQGRLPEIDTDRVAFAGAYHGWGFHEDGARSGLAAADPPRPGLAASRPRPGRDAAPRSTPAIYDDHDPPHPARAVQATLHPPLAHLARRPRRPARPRRPRPLRGAATTSATPSRSIRANVAAFLRAPTASSSAPAGS